MKGSVVQVYAVTIAFALASSQCWASRSYNRVEEDCCECEGSWLAPAVAAVAVVGAACFGSEWLGFGEKGIRKGSWASQLMSLAQRSDVGKEMVSSGQSIGASGLKLTSAFTVGSAAHRLTKGLTSGSGQECCKCP